jgi:hypothetical protein
MDWLDKLEKRLRKSSKSAADAEEISEELDVSLNFLHGSSFCHSFIDMIFSPPHIISKQDQSVGTEIESCLLPGI